jgi:hypothetical protein
MSDTKKPARTGAARGQAYDGFTDEERAAIAARIKQAVS